MSSLMPKNGFDSHLGRKINQAKLRNHDVFSKNSNELYVYRNGKLIYKKWLNTGVSVVLNNPPNWNNVQNKHKTK